MEENLQEITEQLVSKVIKLDTTLKELRQTLKEFVQNFDKSIANCYHDVSIKLIGTKAIIIHEDNQDINYYLAITGLHLDLVSEQINDYRTHIELYDLPPEKMIEVIYQLPALLNNLLEVTTVENLKLTKALLKVKTMLGNKNDA